MAFGPEQLFCLLYVAPDTHKTTLARVLAFVGLRADEHTLQLMAREAPAITTPSRGPCPRASGQKSLRFFQPFNADLAELTGDAGFRDWPVYTPPSTPEGASH